MAGLEDSTRPTTRSRTVNLQSTDLLTAMKLDKSQHDDDRGALQVYMLGPLSFESFVRLQKRLHFDICSDREQAALILCEHPPFISVGRQGSRAHILYEEAELRARQWPVRWLPRGGG